MPLRPRSLLAATLGSTLAVLATGCIYPYGIGTLASPPPRLALPALEAEAHKPPSNAKSARVVLDVEGGSARVNDVLTDAVLIGRGANTVGQAADARLVCERTPCLAELPVGDHDLRFIGTKVGEFTPSFRLETKLLPQPTVYRVTLSARTREPTSLFKTARVTGILGFLVLAGGVAAWGISEGEVDPSLPNPWRVPTLTIAGVGLVTLVVSTILQIEGQGQYVPGSSAAWALGR